MPWGASRFCSAAALQKLVLRSYRCTDRACRAAVSRTAGPALWNGCGDRSQHSASFSGIGSMISIRCGSDRWSRQSTLKAGQGDSLTTDNAILYGMVKQDPNFAVVGGIFTDEPYVLTTKERARAVCFYFDKVFRFVYEGAGPCHRGEPAGHGGQLCAGDDHSGLPDLLGSRVKRGRRCLRGSNPEHSPASSGLRLLPAPAGADFHCPGDC